MRALPSILAVASLAGLLVAGCEVREPTGDIEPEPAAAQAPAEQAAPTALPAPTADTDVTPTAQQPTAQPGSGDDGSCCGSAACQRPGHGGPSGCGCRRNLPPEVAAQVNCGG